MRANQELSCRIFLVAWYLLEYLHFLTVHLLETSQDHHHNDGQQRGEHCAQQVVAAAVLADIHQLGNDPTDHVHPRNGRGKEETGGHGGDQGACCARDDARHF